MITIRDASAWTVVEIYSFYLPVLTTARNVSSTRSGFEKDIKRMIIHRREICSTSLSRSDPIWLLEL